jgi:hypothetical protein
VGIAINRGKILEDGIGGEIIAVEDKCREQRGLWEVEKMGLVEVGVGSIVVYARVDNRYTS